MHEPDYTVSLGGRPVNLAKAETLVICAPDAALPFDDMESRLLGVYVCDVGNCEVYAVRAPCVVRGHFEPLKA